MRNRPQAILLDFYGTVVAEDDPVVSDVCREIATASRPRATASEVAALWWRIFQQLCAASYGHTFQTQRDIDRAVLDLVLERCAADLDAEEMSGRLYAYWTAPLIFPENRDVLVACSTPICLVSNIDTADLRSALAHVGISPDYAVTSQDARAYKPRREPFERALALLNCSPHDALHMGDSFSSDVLGARAAGIPVLWINRKRRPPPAEFTADFVAEDLRGLLAILDGE